MTTVSTSLFSVSASVIQVRLLYGYGNGNKSFFHYGNKQVPSLVAIKSNKRHGCQWELLSACI